MNIIFLVLTEFLFNPCQLFIAILKASWINICEPVFTNVLVKLKSKSYFRSIISPDIYERLLDSLSFLILFILINREKPFLHKTFLFSKIF